MIGALSIASSGLGDSRQNALHGNQDDRPYAAKKLTLAVGLA